MRPAILTTILLVAASMTPVQTGAESPLIAKTVSKIDRVAAAGPFKPEWDSLEQYQIPQWYKDAKLGIFIHWGVYSVPAFGSEWYPRNMYIEKEGWQGKVFRHHKETSGDQSSANDRDYFVSNS